MFLFFHLLCTNSGVNITNMDFINTVQSVLNKAQSLAGEPRVPFLFGSVKSLGGSPPVGNVLSFMNTLLRPDLNDVRDALDPGVTLTGMSSGLLSLTKFIRLMVNPETLNITPYVRIPEVKTGGGRTYYHWLDDEGRAVEAYRLTLKGQTGNIRPGAPDAKLKLYWFIKLRELTLEPYWTMMPAQKISTYTQNELIPTLMPSTLEGGLPGPTVIGNVMAPVEHTVVSTEYKKVRNYQYIMLATVGLPMPILFTGFYMKPIMHSESAANQFSIAWDLDFVIESMYPRMEQISDLCGWTLLGEDLIEKLVSTAGSLTGIGL